MRPRAEVLGQHHQVQFSPKGNANGERVAHEQAGALLEVLLDIRDILSGAVYVIWPPTAPLQRGDPATDPRGKPAGA